MQNIVLSPRGLFPRALTGLLPDRLYREAEMMVQGDEMIEEVRLRRGHCASLTVNGRNLRLSVVLSGAEMDGLLLAMCEGALYAHSETIKEGYLILRDGIRVGVCGRVCPTEGHVNGVCDIASLSIRIPHISPPVGGDIADLLRRFSLTRGVLIFAPPAVGKTTVLRSLITQMAGGEQPLRVAVVDTRGELAFGLDAPRLLVDLLSGYPRGLGISVAARTLSAELIVCDEIGDLEEAREIVQAHNSGVPLLASAHAANVSELLARPALRLLHEARCFGAYVRLFRRQGSFDFTYNVMEWEAADALL